MKLEYIKDLMKTLDNSNLYELIIKDGDSELILKKEIATIPQVVAARPDVVIENSVAPQEKPDKIDKIATSDKDQNLDIYYLESPLIGTFYRAPSPEAAPYVEVGSVVKKGDALCIIEAMKIMNVIESEVNGVVEAIYIETSHFVEYNSKILAIKKS